MIVTQAQLKAATGIKQVDALVRCLAQQGIRFFYGKKGTIWTTEAELNAALDGHKTQPTEKIEF